VSPKLPHLLSCGQSPHEDLTVRPYRAEARMGGDRREGRGGKGRMINGNA